MQKVWTYKGAPTAKELQSKESVVKVNKRKRDKKNKGNESKKAKKQQEEISQSGSPQIGI